MAELSVLPRGRFMPVISKALSVWRIRDRKVGRNARSMFDSRAVDVVVHLPIQQSLAWCNADLHDELFCHLLNYANTQRRNLLIVTKMGPFCHAVAIESFVNAYKHREMSLREENYSFSCKGNVAWLKLPFSFAKI